MKWSDKHAGSAESSVHSAILIYFMAVVLKVLHPYGFNISRNTFYHNKRDKANSQKQEIQQTFIDNDLWQNCRRHPTAERNSRAYSSVFVRQRLFQNFPKAEHELLLSVNCIFKQERCSCFRPSQLKLI